MLYYYAAADFSFAAVIYADATANNSRRVAEYAADICHDF